MPNCRPLSSSRTNYFRHHERIEVIHTLVTLKLDCHASLAMTGFSSSNNRISKSLTLLTMTVGIALFFNWTNELYHLKGNGTIHTLDQQNIASSQVKIKINSIFG